MSLKFHNLKTTDKKSEAEGLNCWPIVTVSRTKIKPRFLWQKGHDLSNHEVSKVFKIATVYFPINCTYIHIFLLEIKVSSLYQANMLPHSFYH